MKTKLAALVMMAAVGLSGCYTEFATTGGNYGGYGSSGNYSPGYYGSQDSSYSYYDTTNAPIINNYYGSGNYLDYGYNYPYSYNSLNYNYFTPSPAWWSSTDWSFGLGWGWNSWGGYPYSLYGGFGWGSPYSYYSPYGSYYSPYYYSPWWGYPIYVYQSGTQSPARTRGTGDTRNGRGEYGGGSPGSTYVQPSAGASAGGANSGARASANTQPAPAPATRTRANSAPPPSTGTVEQPRTRVRESTPPPQENPAPTVQPSPQASPPQAPPPAPQPRVRQSAPGRDSSFRSGDGGQGRTRGMTSSYRPQSRPVRQFLYPQGYRVERVMPLRREGRSNYVPIAREFRSPAPLRAENMTRVEAPRISAPFREAAPAASAPAPTRSGSSGGARARH